MGTHIVKFGPTQYIPPQQKFVRKDFKLFRWISNSMAIAINKRKHYKMKMMKNKTMMKNKAMMIFQI
jgi:hypothetical protein